MLTRREQILRDALAELIEVDRCDVSVMKPFAELGIDSLAGLRLARKIQEQLQAEIELEWLYEYPSIRQLASFLDERFGILETGRVPLK